MAVWLPADISGNADNEFIDAAVFPEKEMVVIGHKSCNLQGLCHKS